MSRSIEISYALQLPTVPAAAPQAPAKSSKLSFPISPNNPASPLSNTTQYYTSTSASLLSAQAALNERLTYWKDVVGDGEKAKEDVGVVPFGRGKAMELSRGAMAMESESEGEDQ